MRFQVKTRYIILCMFFFLELFGCDFKFNMIRYANKEYGFSVFLPQNWQIEEGVERTVVMARAPEGQTKFQTNINVTVGDIRDTQARMPKKFTFEQYYEMNKAQILEALPGQESNIQEGRVIAGKNIGRSLSFDERVRDRNLQQDFNLRFIIATWMKGDRVYSITCATELDKLPRYLPIFKKVLKSFRPS